MGTLLLIVLILLILFLIYGGFNFWHWFVSTAG
jgi:hypothetical protein